MYPHNPTDFHYLRFLCIVHGRIRSCLAYIFIIVVRLVFVLETTLFLLIVYELTQELTNPRFILADVAKAGRDDLSTDVERDKRWQAPWIALSHVGTRHLPVTSVGQARN